MPLVDYITPSGSSVEKLVHSPIPDVIVIDGVNCRRSPASRFAFVGTPKPSLGSEVLRGYYDQECKNGARFHSRFSAEKVKRAWANDKADDES